MTNHRLRQYRSGLIAPAATALAVTALALAGCSPAAQTEDPTPVASEASASPSPSATVAALDDRPLDQQLFEAVQAGDVALASLALEAGQTPDFLMLDSTPLAVACGRNDLEMATLLIDAGATVVSDQGDHIYDAVRTGGADVVKLLLDNGSSAVGPEGFEGDVLAAAAFAGNVPAMEALIAAGAPVDGLAPVNGVDYTPIFAAAYGGSVEAVEYLIEQGADPYAPAPDGATPSQWAFSAGNDEVVAFLATIGA